MAYFTQVFNWGLDQLSQHTKHTPTPRLCSYHVLIQKIACGHSHAAFISKTGHTYSMGNNDQGQLGIGDFSIQVSNTPCLLQYLLQQTIVDIDCGSNFTVGVSMQGDAFTWGQSCGFTTSWSPVKLPLTSITSISCGNQHAGAIVLQQGVSTLFLWGNGSKGQLGSESTEKILKPFKLPSYEPVAIACGKQHTLVLGSTQLYATGENSEGQLGTGDKISTSKFTPVLGLRGKAILKIAAGSFSACVTVEGQVYIWGNSSVGESLVPKLVASPNEFASVSIGDGFGVLLDYEKRVWSWGKNQNGELGLGHLRPSSALTKIPILAAKQIKQVACGDRYVIALGSDLAPIQKKQSKTQRSTSNKRKQSPTMKQPETTPRNWTPRAKLSNSSTKKKIHMKEQIHKVKKYMVNKGNSSMQSGVDQVISRFQKMKGETKKNKKKNQQQRTVDSEYKIKKQISQKNLRKKLTQFQSKVSGMKENLAQTKTHISNLQQQNRKLKEALEEQTNKKQHYLACFNREYEARKTAEQSSIIRLRDYQQQIASLKRQNREQENTIRSLKGLLAAKKGNPPYLVSLTPPKAGSIQRYQQSPGFSQVSQQSPLQHIRRLSDCYESVLPVELPMSFRDNNPPTFRQGSQRESRGSLYNFKSRFNPIQTPKQTHPYSRKASDHV